MIELHETTRVAAIWRVQGNLKDWMGMLLKQQDGPWQFLYRFRYYQDDKLGTESNDVKNWYQIVANDDAPEDIHVNMEETADMVARMTSEEFGNPVEKIIVNGSGIDAANKLSYIKGFHVRSESDSGYEA